MLLIAANLWINAVGCLVAMILARAGYSISEIFPLVGMFYGSLALVSLFVAVKMANQTGTEKKNISTAEAEAGT